MKILLTNDDGWHSLLLPFLIKYLGGLGELKVLVPEHEQSWKGKSITRFGVLEFRERRLAGEEIHTLEGTPADCANVGIYHLFDGGRPDLVVSGINQGHNTGLGFVWSSGTVGACLEANIAGIPALAFSQQLSWEFFSSLAAGEGLPAAMAEHLGRQTDSLLRMSFAQLLPGGRLPNEPVTWSVNFPLEAAVDTEFCQVPAGRVVYGSLFRRKGSGFAHDLASEDVRSLDRETDYDVVASGHVSASRIDLWSLGVGWRE